MDDAAERMQQKDGDSEDRREVHPPSAHNIMKRCYLCLPRSSTPLYRAGRRSAALTLLLDSPPHCAAQPCAQPRCPAPIQHCCRRRPTRSILTWWLYGGGVCESQVAFVSVHAGMGACVRVGDSARGRVCGVRAWRLVWVCGGVGVGFLHRSSLDNGSLAQMCAVEYLSAHSCTPVIGEHVTEHVISCDRTLPNAVRCVGCERSGDDVCVHCAGLGAHASTRELWVGGCVPIGAESRGPWGLWASKWRRRARWCRGLV